MKNKSPDKGGGEAYLPQYLPLIITYLFLTRYLIEAPFDAFANGADPDQAALVRAA